MKTKIKNILEENIYTYIAVVLIFCISIYSTLLKNTKAEQMGSSPDSGGAQSVIMRAYNTLVSKGTNYGSSSSPDWTLNHGTYWNRIIYSATWEPDGTATEQDVLSTKTFYSGLNNRTIRTGTVSSFSIDYSQESLIEYDDYEAGESSEDSALEESSWTNTATNVWKDTRTGLYWSSSIGSYTNIFPNQDHSTCDFFSTVPRGDYGTSGTDPDCGNAINACAVLNLTSGGTSNTDWYLPSIKELKQAVRDGIYNQTGATFTTSSYFWSSTENSGNSTLAWNEYLYNGSVGGSIKTSNRVVRCVRRD